MGLGKGLKTVLGSTHVVEQFLFSIFSSIITFDFDLIFGIFYYLGPLWASLGVGEGSKTVLGSTHLL